MSLRHDTDTVTNMLKSADTANMLMFINLVLASFYPSVTAAS